MATPVADSYLSCVILKLEIFVFSNQSPHATVDFGRVFPTPEMVGHGDGGYGLTAVWPAGDFLM